MSANGSHRKIRVYIAAPFIHRDKAREARDYLIREGYEVTAHWLDLESDSDDPPMLRREAQQDWHDVITANVLLLLNISKSEGKAVEQGIALQKGIPIVAIGRPSNVFHRLPHYTWVDTLGKAIQAFPTLNPELETDELSAAMRLHKSPEHKTILPDTTY